MEYLAITAMTANQSLLFEELLKLIAKHECNVVDSRMIRLGSEFATMLLVSGNWSTIAKLEAAIPLLNEQIDLNILIKRTTLPKLPENLLPYLIQVIALDNPGLIYDISCFFLKQEILINDIQTNPYTSHHSDTQMVSLLMSVSIPADINLSDLRESFMLLCDDLNVDGILEPEKR